MNKRKRIAWLKHRRQKKKSQEQRKALRSTQGDES